MINNDRARTAPGNLYYGNIGSGGENFDDDHANAPRLPPFSMHGPCFCLPLQRHLSDEPHDGKPGAP